MLNLIREILGYLKTFFHPDKRIYNNEIYYWLNDTNVTGST
jgi:hypothetical protein